MKFKSVLTVASLCVLTSGLLSNTANAAVAADNNQQMAEELQKLEQQVNTLNSEIKQLKNQQHKVIYVVPKKTKTAKYHHLSTKPRSLEEHFGKQPPYLRTISVTTSPYLGLRSAFDASDLVTNLPTMNEDLRLLQQRELLETNLQQAHLDPLAENRALLILSGALEGEGIYQSPYQGNSTTDIDLTKMEFDVLSYVSPWALGLISMRYDNSPFPDVTIDTNNNGINSAQVGQIIGAGQRVANSRVYLRRGFITIGDLHRFPLYFSVGQMFAPFGQYSSYMLSSPMTQLLGQTNQRLALLGFAEKGFYLEGYTFHGSSTVSNNGVNNGGGNIGYKFANGGPIKWELGGGGIANIADAIAMQNTGANLPAFPGFGFNSATEMLVHRVPGLNAHAELDIKQLSLLGEFVGATQQFAPANLTYDRAGAQPRAMHFEGDYSFNFIHFPTVFTLAYDHSWQALGLNLPQNSYTGDINISFWKDTIETIEYRHDTNYPSGTTAFSTNIAGYSPGGGFNNTTGAPLANNLVAFPTVSQGGSQNTVILQAGLYF